jgi:hypothetical protein
MQSAIERGDGVPVIRLEDKFSSCKFANWPNSAGMGPEVCKTQSKHATNKSPYPTGTKGHKECKSVPSYWMQVRGKRDVVPVSWLTAKLSRCKIANWPNSAGMGPEGYKTQSKHTTNKSPYPTGTKWHKECKYTPSYWMQIRGKRDGVPVSWFSCKKRCCKLTNRPNSAGMGPGVYKTQSKHAKKSHPIRLVRKGMWKASLFLHVECNSVERRMEYR